MKFIIRFTLIIFLLIPFKFTVSTQSPYNAETIVKEAESLKEKGNYEMANQKLKLAAETFKKEGKNGLYVKYSAELAKNLIEKAKVDEAQKLLENLIKEVEASSYSNDENIALPYKYLGTVYYEKDNLSKATPYFKKALEIREKANPKSNELFRDYYNLGVMYRNIGRYNESIIHLKKSISLSDNNNPELLPKLYLQLATVFKITGYFSESEDYIDIAIKEIEGSNPGNPQLAKYYLEKGTLQKEQAVDFNALNKSLATLNKALNLFEKQNEKDVENYVTTLMNIGILYNIGLEPQLNKEDEIKAAKNAIPYLEKAVSEIRKKNPDGTTALVAKNNLAFAYAKAREADKANNLAKEASALANELYEKNNSIFSDIRLIYFENYEYQEKYDDALKMIHEAIVNLSSPTDILNTPDWKLIQDDKVENLNYLKELIAKKARIFIKKYQSDKSSTNLEHALKHLEFTDKIVDKIRSDISSNGSKMIVSDMIIDAYEMAISACLELSKIKKENSYKEKAYFFSEKSKSLILLEAFQNSKAANMAGLSSEIIQDENQLRISITDLKQQIFQCKSRGESNSAEAKKLEKELFNKKQEYSNYLKKIEKENPEYFKLKYDLKISTLADTRKLLKKDQGLIEYFTGNKKLFIFKITATDFEVFEIDNNQDLSGLSRKFRESLFGFYINSNTKSDESYDKYAQEYASYGTELYERLVKPLGSLPKRLIIVPSGPLSNIPFESLLSVKPEKYLQFKTHKYFGNNHILSYSYSATLLAEMSSRKYSHFRKDFIGFAPSFGADNQDGVTMRNRRFSLAPLNYNGKEINDVKKILGNGDVYFGKDASEEKFKKVASNYNIIHFATHGMANDKDPDFSLLAFTEIRDSIENEFLYVSDLYNMKLNADLVVLSACETGLGELRRGEGIVSLARGFSYAGAKSIFTTLWSVNDQSTSIIIESFYKYLKEGKDKDEALHLAKIDFIKSADNNRAHPFLWAPYILIGDCKAIELGEGSLTWIYISVSAFILLLLITGILLQKKIKRQK